MSSTARGNHSCRRKSRLWRARNFHPVTNTFRSTPSPTPHRALRERTTLWHGSNTEVLTADSSLPLEDVHQGEGVEGPQRLGHDAPDGGREAGHGPAQGAPLLRYPGQPGHARGRVPEGKGSISSRVSGPREPFRSPPKPNGRQELQTHSPMGFPQRRKNNRVHLASVELLKKLVEEPRVLGGHARGQHPADVPADGGRPWAVLLTKGFARPQQRSGVPVAPSPGGKGVRGLPQGDQTYHWYCGTSWG